MKEQIEIATGISITNACYQCQILGSYCLDCVDARDAKDTNMAYEIVDERNLIYPNQWSNIELTDTSWAEAQSISGTSHRLAKIVEVPVTRYKDSEPYESTQPQVIWEEPDSDYTFRNEYAPPITNLLDRLQGYWFLGQHIYPLRSEADIQATIKLNRFETICPECHLTYNKNYTCQNV